MGKQKLSAEELSRIRSEAGRRGGLATTASGNRRGGRPRALPGELVPVRSLSIRQPDYESVVYMANADDLAIAAMIHKIVEDYRNNVFVEPRDRVREAAGDSGSQPAVPKEIQDLRMRMLKKMISLEEYDRLRDAYNAEHGTKF